jgi:hypothetical protein
MRIRIRVKSRAGSASGSASMRCGSTTLAERYPDYQGLVMHVHQLMKLEEEDFGVGV